MILPLFSVPTSSCAAFHKLTSPGFRILITAVETIPITASSPWLSAAALSAPGNQIITVTGLSNREFLERYARPGRVGLSGGVTLVDRAIARAQRNLDPEEL